jgi:hypothetical protein
MSKIPGISKWKVNSDSKRERLPKNFNISVDTSRHTNTR